MSDLSARARSAVVWNTAFNLFRDVLQFLTMLVLVRLLQPESYGEFALTTSVIGFLSILSLNNFIAHVLQVQSSDEIHLQDHFTAGAVIQVALFGLTNLFAAALWWSQKYAQVAPLVHVMSVTFLLEWPCEIRRKMLERELDWRRLRLLHAIGLLGGAGLALVLALAGAGTYALLLPGLLSTLPFIYDLFICIRWRPTWAWSLERYRPAMRFGLSRIGSGVAVSGRTLVESAVLSVALNFAGLGIYSRAYGLAQLFCAKFASQLTYAIYPLLPRIGTGGGDGGRVGDLVLRLIAWGAVPIAVVLGVLAVPIVRVVYGSGWESVAPLLPWAVTLAVLLALSQTANQLLLARQQARLCVASDSLFLVGTVIALAIALPHGAVAYLGALAGVQVALLILLGWWLLLHQAATAAGVRDATVPPMLAAAVAGCVVLLLVPESLVGTRNDRSPGQAVCWGGIFAVLYVIGLRLTFLRQLEALVRHFPGRAIIGRALFLPRSSL